MQKFLPLLISAAILLATIGVVWADFVPSASMTGTPLSVTNTGTATQTGLVWPSRLSAQGMLDGGFIESTALASHMIGASGSGPYTPDTNEIPYMPGTLATDVQAYYLYDTTGATYTDYTTEANSGVAGSVPTVDGDPEANDAILIGVYNPAQMLRFTVTTVGTTAYSASYCVTSGCNPATAGNWQAFSSQSPSSVAFASTGLVTHQWALSSSDNDWLRFPNAGAGVTTFWIRLLLTSGSTGATLAQVSWENMQWWTISPSLAPLEQATYTLYTLPTTGSADLTYHQYFSGPTGITTPDDATIEPGSAYEFTIEGFWDVSTGTGKCAFSKASAVSLCPLSSTQYRFTNAGATNLDFNLSTGHHTVNIVRAGATTEVFVDGVSAGSAGAMNVTGNASDWVWAADGTTDAYRGALPYFDFISLEVSGIERLRYQLDTIPSINLIDQSGNGNDSSLASFPRMPSNTTRAISPSFPVTPNTGAPPDPGPAVQPGVTPIPTGDGSGTNQIGYTFLNQLLGVNSAELPIEMFYLIGTILLMFILGAITYNLTRGNFMASMFVPILAGAFFAFSGGGALPFGIVVVAGIVGLGLLVANREGVI